MTITGRQIQEARRLLGWNCATASARAGVAREVVMQAEIHDCTEGISAYQAGLVRQAFERAGIRFGRNGAVLQLKRLDNQPR